MQSKKQTRSINPMTVCIVLALTMFFIVEVASASYKKPPFNGSIFGKRSNSLTDNESVGRTFSTLCEIASEACSAWFLQIDRKK